MTGRIGLLLVYLALVNGTLAARKPWHWHSRMPVRSPIDSFQPSGRVMGMKEATPDSWPHLVALFIDNIFSCSGTLISNEWVVTAAHCMDGASFVEVIMGGWVNEEYEVSMTSFEFLVHENWSSFTLTNDIALIKLPQPVDFNEYIGSVGLASVDVAEGDVLTVPIWGIASEGARERIATITEESVRALSNAECRDIYGIVDDNVVCVETVSSHGFCQGISGTSLNNGGNTYGIGSFGSSAGCEAGYPAAFTRIFNYLDWIEEHTGITPPSVTM